MIRPETTASDATETGSEEWTIPLILPRTEPPEHVASPVSTPEAAISSRPETNTFPSRVPSTTRSPSTWKLPRIVVPLSIFKRFSLPDSRAHPIRSPRH